MSPVFGHGRLRLYLLKLLADEPRHGYDVIRALEDRFLGLYAPSAGTVYPRLSRLETEGLVTHTEQEGRKVYRITDAGRAELARRAGELADLEGEIAELVGSVRDMARDIRDEVRGSVRDLRSELRQAARDIRRQDRATARGSDPRAGRDIERLIDAFREDARRVVRISAIDESSIAAARASLEDALARLRQALGAPR